MSSPTIKTAAPPARRLYTHRAPPRLFHRRPLSATNGAKLAAQLDTLTGKDYIDVYVKLAEFVTPKLQRTALAADGAGDVRITDFQIIDYKE